MKVGIISDTHDDLDNTTKAVSLFNRYNTKYVIHCGDYVFPGIVLEFSRLKKGCKFVGVLGNNDGEKYGLKVAFERANGVFFEEYGEITIDGLNFGIYHGTSQQLKKKLEELDRLDVLLTGHTHKKEKELQAKPILLNPGSAHKKVTKSQTNAFASKPQIMIFDTKTRFVQSVSL